MRAFVGVTDYDWYRFLSALPERDEVNFWQPSGGTAFQALQPGELFLFKLHSPRNYIVGGGLFAHWSRLPVSMAWEVFGWKNGVPTLADMRGRLARYRRTPEDARVDYPVGCILLEQPFFLEERDWIPVPEDWSPNIVRGKTYGSDTVAGRRLLSAVVGRQPGALVPAPEAPYVPQPVFETRSSRPSLVYPRLGQGTFRVLVTDLYERRCVVTGERTLPVLQAAHIKPVSVGGPHDPQNGLLLRSDLHALFDRGYVTVTPDLRLEVSKRIREEFTNGRDYYALHGRELRHPQRAECLPAAEYLDWHSANLYRG